MSLYLSCLCFNSLVLFFRPFRWSLRQRDPSAWLWLSPWSPSIIRAYDARTSNSLQVVRIVLIQVFFPWCWGPFLIREIASCFLTLVNVSAMSCLLGADWGDSVLQSEVSPCCCLVKADEDQFRGQAYIHPVQLLPCPSCVGQSLIHTSVILVLSALE